MNILFITADQWRGECLSALGHPDLKTPNLDQLAGDGVLFARRECWLESQDFGTLASEGFDRSFNVAPDHVVEGEAES